MPPSWQPVPACTRNGHSAGGPLFPATTTKLQAGRSILRQRASAGGTAILCDKENWNRTQHRLRLRLLQAGYSTCRNDGTAVIPDFRPRIGNRCSKKVKTRAIRASILDFKPRLANRCSNEVKTRAICASILDFRPKLANRCSQEVKTGVIPPAQGLEHCAAAGEYRMGRDFGRRSRPWLRER